VSDALSPTNNAVSWEIGRITGIDSTRPGAWELSVALPGRAASEKAVFYPALAPSQLSVGDYVILNTSAVRLNLGTGGLHFIIAKIAADLAEQNPAPPVGHIMKLRYTPLQIPCLAVEEQLSPFHEILAQADNLAGLPVVVAGLHSQIAPIAAAVKAETGGKAKIAYIMNDSGALPISFSRLVANLKDKGLLEVTITAGQAFGGDLEAVNLYTALLAAKYAAESDLAIVAQGPGNVGTESLFGFGAIYQGEAINAISILKGRPVAALRLSFADPRVRHQGVSRQCLIALGRVALVPANLVLPDLEAAKLLLLKKQLIDEGLLSRHQLIIETGEPGLEELSRRELAVTTMGRGFEADKEFFLAAAAAGRAAAKLIPNQA